MFRNSKGFVGLLTAIVLLGFLVGQLELGRDVWTPGLISQSPPIPQAQTERQWREKPERVLFTLGEEDLLAGPLELKVDGAGHLFVADYNQSKVYQFSESGTLMTTFGNGYGEGPGEFQALTDFAIAPSGLWITDPTNGAISRFSAEGTLQDTFKTRQPIHRLAAMGDSVYGKLTVAEKSFARLRETSEGLDLGLTFGEIVTEQFANSILLDGWTEAGPENGLVYVPRHLSFFTVYDADGSTRFSAATIDPHPTPKVITDNGARWVDRDAPKSALGANVFGDELYILTAEDWFSLEKRGSIDAYSLIDGRYLYSMRVPEPCQKILVTDRYVYTVLEDTVRQWQRVL